MIRNNMTKQYEPEGKIMFKSVDLILTNHSTPDVSIIDFKTIYKREGIESIIQGNKLSFALVFEAHGLLLCGVSNYKNTIISEQPIVCTDDVNSFYYPDDSALAIHYEIDHPDNRLYLVSATPPKVTEFDISNFQNFHIAKIYIAQAAASRRFVAQSQIAVNYHQVMLLMRDVYTNQFVIRIFCRHASFFSIVLQDIYLPQQSRFGFFQFPNFYFNKFLFRDERTVNITQANFPMLMVNRSELMLKDLQKKGGDLLNDQSFQVKVFHDVNLLLSTFNITFVDRFNTTIFHFEDHGYNGVEVFYSCGDTSFTYDLTKLFHGPDFKLKCITQGGNAEEQNYFHFSNSRETTIVNNTLQGINCKVNIIVPALNGTIIQQDTLIMVCMNLENAQFTTYKIPLDNHDMSPGTNLNEVSNITIPFSSVLSYQYDVEQRVIIALVAIDGKSTIEYPTDQIEVHYFHIGSCMNWKNKHSISNSTFTFNSKTDYYGYSAAYQKGLFLWNSPIVDQPGMINVTILMFSLNFIEYTMTDQKYYSYISPNGNFIKALITSNNMIMVLTQDNKVITMQVFPEVIKVINEHSSLHPEKIVIDFDFMDDQYLVLYHNDSTTEIYTSIDSTEIIHKMNLPLYKRFENFTYRTYSYNQYPKRDWFENTLALLMNNTQTNETVILVYKFDETQHNSLYMANASFGYFFEESTYSWIVLTGDYDDFTKHYLGMVSEKGLLLVELRYYDRLHVDMDSYKSLIDSCKNYLPIDSNPLQYMDSTTIITQLGVFPTTEISRKEDEVVDQPLNLTVRSNNIGFALTPAMNHKQVVAYGNSRTNHNQQIVMAESFIQGYNIQFTTQCSFKDEEGREHNCSGGLTKNLTIVQYQYPLDFATSQRQVHHSYPIAQYVMTLDSIGSIQVLSLPSNFDMDKNNEFRPMEKQTELSQQEEFGCQLHDSSYFGKMFKINQTSCPNQAIFLFFYQCEIQGSWSLSAVEITVFLDRVCDDQSNQKSCIEIRRFKKPEKIVYNIIDVELVNLTYTAQNAENITSISSLSYAADVAVVCRIDQSYSNLLLIYKMELNGSVNGNHYMKEFQNMTLMMWNSATKCLWNTFKVNRVSAIPNTKLLVASIDNYGAILYHTGRNEIIFTVNLTEYEEPDYLEQVKEKYDGLEVFGVETNVPYSMFIFSNYGIYIFGFNYSFFDEEAILRPQPMIKPSSIKKLRFPFKIEQAKIIISPYGFAILANAPSGKKTFTVKLIAVTHYSGFQSKLFRVLDIISNSNCTAFSRNPFVEYAPMDQFGTSFICESRLRVVRFCLRPNVKIDLQPYSQYSSKATDYGLRGGNLQFNDFNLTIAASNEFTTDTGGNLVTVPVKIEYQKLPNERTDVLTFVIVVLTFSTIVILFLFLQSRIDKACPYEGQMVKNTLSSSMVRRSLRSDVRSIYQKTYESHSTDQGGVMSFVDEKLTRSDIQSQIEEDSSLAPSSAFPNSLSELMNPMNGGAPMKPLDLQSSFVVSQRKSEREGTVYTFGNFVPGRLSIQGEQRSVDEDSFVDDVQSQY